MQLMQLVVDEGGGCVTSAHRLLGLDAGPAAAGEPAADPEHIEQMADYLPMDGRRRVSVDEKMKS
jgi:hypothetical protein